MDLSGPRVCDDMTVEVALSVMAGAQVGFLLLCDRDEQVTGSITRSRLVAVRDGSAYTDRIRLRDILRVDGPFALPVTTLPAAAAVSGAGHPTRYRQPGVLSAAVGEHRPATGALALSH
ncbi:hypothetical protein O1Q96_02475 [Streptomyces sp. Qhu-G9]|nr:hypothetical protein [Streptomyces aurantiacus]WAU86098.1 hypothetical protein O1Q96_02475 [Streptomyces aurantiacus]